MEEMEDWDIALQFRFGSPPLKKERMRIGNNKLIVM